MSQEEELIVDRPHGRRWIELCEDPATLDKHRKTFSGSFILSSANLFRLLHYAYASGRLVFKYVYDVSVKQMVLGSVDAQHLKIAREMWGMKFTPEQTEHDFPPTEITGGNIEVFYAREGQYFVLVVNGESGYFDQRILCGENRNVREMADFKNAVRVFMSDLLNNIGLEYVQSSFGSQGARSNDFYFRIRPPFRRS